MSEPGPFVELLGQLAFTFSKIQPLIPTYIHLVLSALFPIYAGAHASLSRPPSAAKPQRKSRKLTERKDNDGDEDDEEGEEDEDSERRMEGLSPSDALMFPVLAGITLSGLYFLIKVLNNPELLNKILNWYFAVFGIVSVAKLVADALGWVSGLVFPREYVESGILWRVDGRKRRVTAVAGHGTSQKMRTWPLPGAVFSVVPTPRRASDALWAVREVVKQKWTVQVHVQHVVTAKTHVGLADGIGLITALTASLYYNLFDKPWWLTNLFGFGFCYGAIQLMSPTTFATGGLLLGALFFYDVYFVFYTPMMITVAKTLDIPIKLLFPRPAPPGSDAELAKQKLHAMLGLGDIVLPGIMIGLALRFDLFLHYLKKQKPAPSTVDGSEKVQPIKAHFRPLAGRQGDAFWTHSILTGRSLLPSRPSDTTSPADRDGYHFSKPYFRASLVGYTIGLLTTLVFMHIYDHGQPALLYLVPGVLGSLLIAGLARGELRTMWAYTEEEEDEVHKEVKAKADDDEIKPEQKEKEEAKLHASDDKKEIGENEDKQLQHGKLIDVDGHKETLLFSFSVSKREPSRPSRAPAAATDEDSDGARRSFKIKTIDGEPPHKVRRLS